jgi:hypothetical protein
MSFEDDIFDIERELKGKPEAKQFHRIIMLFNKVEAEAEEYRKKYDTVRAAIMFIQETDNLCNPDEADKETES